MEFILIAAVGRNGEMGLRGDLPWSHPEDLKFFKETTRGAPLLMGRKTFESLPGILAGRPHLVLSQSVPTQSPASPLVHFFSTWADAKQWCIEQDYPQAFIIGGKQIYALLSPYCSKMILTHMDSSFEADTFFPLEILKSFRVEEKKALLGPSFSHYGAEIRYYTAVNTLDTERTV